MNPPNDKDRLRPASVACGFPNGENVKGLHVTRGGTQNLHRDETQKARQLAKADPVVATALEAAGLSVAPPGPDAASKRARLANFRGKKGGRKPGRRTRAEMIAAEAERAQLKALRAMNRGGDDFWDNLRRECPYLLIQHVKPAAPRWTPDDAKAAPEPLRVVYVDECISAPGDTAPPARRPATIAPAASEAPAPTLNPPDIPTRHAGDTALLEQTPAPPPPSPVLALLDAAKGGDATARDAIRDAAVSLGIDLDRKTREAAEEAQRLAKERREAAARANRARMFDDPNCWH